MKELGKEIEWKDIPIGAECCLPTCRQVVLVKLSEDKYVLKGQTRVWNWRESYLGGTRKYILLDDYERIETLIIQLKKHLDKI